MRENDVEITICIGLFGACVISIVGDESELVYFDVCSWGDAIWCDQLPEHEQPIEGVYKITVDAWENDTQTAVCYEIKDCEHYKVVKPKAVKPVISKDCDNQLSLVGV
tara:strand:+ start:1610 stop:1933 length:324 start_codon:yes stop_codon:yes gene_type:complete